MNLSNLSREMRSLFHRDPINPMARRTFVIFALSFALVLFVGKAYYDTNTIEVKHYQIKDSPLGEALAGLKVAFLTDLHIRSIDVRQNKILEILHEEKPDLILLSGDYISFKGPYEPVMSFFHQFKAPYGVYGVLGNTEYSNENGSCILCHHEQSTLRLPGLKAWPRPRPETLPNLSTLSRSRPKGSGDSLRPRGSGLTLSGDSMPRFQRDNPAPPNGSKDLKEKQNPIFLRNAASVFEANHKKINIFGVDNPVNKKSNLSTTLKGTNSKGPSILLAHSPEIFEEASGYGIDLILSGHNHGGQIFITKILGKFLPFDPVLQFLEGFFQEGKTLMYVSRGVGTSYLPFRLGVKPEITFFEFSVTSTNSSNLSREMGSLFHWDPSNPSNPLLISNNPPKTIFSGLSLSNLVETVNIFGVIRDKFVRRHSRNSNVLLDFESEEDLKRLNWECHKWFELSEENATSGKYSLKVSIPPGQYPGINFQEFINDWSKDNYFRIDVFNPSEERITFHIRIDDNKSGWEYADRFDINFELKQGINQILIPTDAIRTNIHHRPLNLKRIKRMMVFIPNNSKQRELYIDNVHLE